MIPNFFKVDDGVWRGGQPQTPEDWDTLSSIGVVQVIKLNPESEGQDPTIRSDMTFFEVPISTGEQIFTEPELYAIRDAVAFITPGTFVHCSHGQDRTGLVIGVYRVTRCGWAKDDAWREMMAHGFHPILLGLVRAWEELTRC